MLVHAIAIVFFLFLNILCFSSSAQQQTGKNIYRILLVDIKMVDEAQTSLKYQPSQQTVTKSFFSNYFLTRVEKGFAQQGVKPGTTRDQAMNNVTSPPMSSWFNIIVKRLNLSFLKRFCVDMYHIHLNGALKAFTNKVTRLQITQYDIHQNVNIFLFSKP